MLSLALDVIINTKPPPCRSCKIVQSIILLMLFIDCDHSSLQYLRHHTINLDYYTDRILIVGTQLIAMFNGTNCKCICQHSRAFWIYIVFNVRGMLRSLLHLVESAASQGTPGRGGAGGLHQHQHSLLLAVNG